MRPLKIVKPYAAAFRRNKHTVFHDRAEALLAKVGLTGFGDRRPWELSGGMLQRANLCRALIHSPKLLMLDEPFGALDQFTREELWSILQELWMETRPTVFLVTDDLREAAFLASRILVMSARPGCVTEDRSVHLPRPRTLETTFRPEFADLTNDFRRLIMEARQSNEQARWRFPNVPWITPSPQASSSFSSSPGNLPASCLSSARSCCRRRARSSGPSSCRCRRYGRISPWSTWGYCSIVPRWLAEWVARAAFLLHRER